MNQLQKIADMLQADEWSDSDKAVVLWRFGLHNGFRVSLWEAIICANGKELDQLSLGFPDEVKGYKSWIHGTLAAELRILGLEI